MTATAKKSASDEMTAEKALSDFKWGFDYKKNFIKAADQDIEFALGAQWDDKDLAVLEDKGVLPITVNKIKPIIRLMRGIESQNRSEEKAFPEGSEDSLEADIATRLLKHAMKMDEGNYKVSETFSDGNICGEGWLEPYLNFDRSIIEADLGLRKSDFWSFSWDPNSKEYDLSDAQFFDKITFNWTKDQILAIYPEAESALAGTDGGRLKVGDLGEIPRPDEFGANVQAIDYGKDSNAWDAERPNVSVYDLLEHYYKKYVKHYFIVDAKLGKIQEAATKEEADAHIEQFGTDPLSGKPVAKLIVRRLPEIWVIALVGGINEEVYNGPAWSFPQWKSWPFIPYFAERTTVRIRSAKRDLAVQGVTRNIKSLNQELNKRRTQTLRHLNQSANSGWLTPENAWVDRDKVEGAGAQPGVNLEYKTDLGKPERIFPTPLSAGHAQLAEEARNDMQEASGINADLLAMQEGGTDSGRAIAIRQKQGLVMVQGFFDNLSRTKKILAKFILSQLSQIYTVERAMRVCGDAFIQENFMAPVMGPPIDQRTGQPGIDPKTGQPPVRPDTGEPILVPQADPMTGQPQMQVDMKAAMQAFAKVLNDKDLANYDVAVGETISQDTVAYANFLQLSDMAKSGVPIPPDVLVEESLIPSAQKAKIKSAIEQAQAMQAAAAAKTPPKPKGA